MSKAARFHARRDAARVLAACGVIVTYDSRKWRARSRARLGKQQFALLTGIEIADVPRFYLTMGEHLTEIAELHNAKLGYKRRSHEHAALRMRMRDAVRLVIGDAPFARFVPGRANNELPPMNCEDRFAGDVLWACFQVVDAIDQLARELYHDAAMLIGNYHQALFGWHRLVEVHGVEAINALLTAREAA